MQQVREPHPAPVAATLAAAVPPIVSPRDQMDIPEDDAQKMVSVKDAVEYIAENK